MAKLYAYKKSGGALVLPVLSGGQEVKELINYNEWTIIVANNSVNFPVQPSGIKFREVDGSTFGEKLPRILKLVKVSLENIFKSIDDAVFSEITAKYSIGQQIMFLASPDSEDKDEYLALVAQKVEKGEKQKNKYSLNID